MARRTKVETRARTGLGAILLAACLAGAARADDYYVDAVHGDDGNGGLSSADAWRTLTHAFQSVPAPVSGATHVIHAAAGVHDAALGEVFPLRVAPGLRVIGVAGATVVDGGSTAGTLFVIEANLTTQMQPIGPETGLSALVLRDAGLGVGVSSDWIPCEPSFDVLEIRNMTVAGMSVATASASGAGVAVASVSGALIEDCAYGVRVSEGTDFGTSEARLTDCVIARCQTAGVRVQSAAHIAGVVLTRCRVEDNQVDGFSGWCVNRGSARFELVDCLVRRNGRHGFDLLGENAFGGSAFARFVRSTVVEHPAAGVRAEILYGGAVHLSSSIVTANADDLDDVVGGTFQASHCDIGDGDFLGQSGNFSADPLFADPAAGDFRLRYGSPCVDEGDPADAQAVPDLAGVVRPIDGDLDRTTAVDVGAHELALLRWVEPALPGGAIELELLGPAGESAVLYVARGGVSPVPFTTPFGDLWLPRGAARAARTLSVEPWPPTRVTIPLVNTPALAGLRLGFQTLARTGDPADPFLFTNAVEVQITSP